MFNKIIQTELLIGLLMMSSCQTTTNNLNISLSHETRSIALNEDCTSSLFAPEYINKHVELKKDLLNIEYNRNYQIKKILDFLNAKEPLVRREMVKSLGKMSVGYKMPEIIFNKIIDLLSDPNDCVRANSAYLISTYKFMSNEETKNARLMISNNFSSESSIDAKSNQALALGAIGTANNLISLYNLAKTVKNEKLKVHTLMGVYNYLNNNVIPNFVSDDVLLEQLLTEVETSKNDNSEIFAQVVYLSAVMDKTIQDRPIMEQIIKMAVKASLAQSKQWLLLAAKPNDEVDLKTINSFANDVSPSVRATYLNFVAPNLKDKPFSLEVLLKALKNDKSPMVQYAAALGLNKLSSDSTLKTLLLSKYESFLKIYKNSKIKSVQESLISTLVKISPDKTKKLVFYELESKNYIKQSAAVSQLANYASPEVQTILRQKIDGNNLYVAMTALQTVSNIGESILNEDLKQSIYSFLKKGSSEALMVSGSMSKWKSLPDFHHALSVAYSRAKKNGNPQQIDAVLTGIANSGSLDHFNLIEESLLSLDPRVVQSAMKAYKILQGKDASSVMPLVVPVKMPIPSLEEIDKAIKTIFIVYTTQGEFEITLNPNTPIAATTFKRLVEDKKYDNTTVNWTWPAFFAQFGDTSNGAGWSYGLTSFRDELVLPVDHIRGAVNFIGSGQADSYSGEFLIDQNFRFYDARMINTQTTFGFVSKGMEIVDKITMYDRILKIAVKDY